MSENRQYMLDCPECGESINAHLDVLDYVFGESESGCNGLYEFDRDICICPCCGQRIVRTCEYQPVPISYKVRVYTGERA